MERRERRVRPDVQDSTKREAECQERQEFDCSSGIIEPRLEPHLRPDDSS
jgi:hypothetical protein